MQGDESFATREVLTFVTTAVYITLGKNEFVGSFSEKYFYLPAMHTNSKTARALQRTAREDTVKSPLRRK